MRDKAFAGRQKASSMTGSALAMPKKRGRLSMARDARYDLIAHRHPGGSFDLATEKQTPTLDA